MIQALLASAIFRSVLKWLAIGTGIYIVFRYFGKKADEKRYEKDDKDLALNLAKGQAVALRAAMNPSGSATLFDVDGQNKTAIMNIATEIKDLQAVIDAYNARFKGSLIHHLEIEIGAEEMQRFLALAGGQSTVANTNYDSIKSGVSKSMVRTIKPANARSSAKKTGYFEKSNVLKTFDAYNLIGISTGKTQYDAANDIIFLEAQAKNKRGQIVSFWVAKSQVELIDSQAYQKRKALKELFTHQLLDGLGAIPQMELATSRAAIVYNENFEPVDKVRDRARLGIPSMFLKMPDRVLVRFTTIDGVRRWIDTRYVFLFQPKSI